MKSKLIYLSQYSGTAASVYSVIEQDGEGEATVRFHEFVKANEGKYLRELLELSTRLRAMTTLTGLDEDNFKQYEGKPGDKVCALYDIPDADLRLYCILLTDKILILGSGGPKTTRTWQEDPVLKTEVEFMMEVSEVVHTKLDNGTIVYTEDRLKLTGDIWSRK